MFAKSYVSIRNNLNDITECGNVYSITLLGTLNILYNTQVYTLNTNFNNVTIKCNQRNTQSIEVSCEIESLQKYGALSKLCIVITQILQNPIITVSVTIIYLYY